MELVEYIAVSIFLLIPICTVSLWYFGIILIGSSVVALIFFLILFVIVPLIYKNSYTFQRSVLFLSFVPGPADLEHPDSVGMKSTRNFYIRTEDNVTLGVWHVLPSSLLSEEPEKEKYETMLNKGRPIFMYVHGNSGNRATPHRVCLYKILQQHDNHIIAFDYRNFGDSSPRVPSERAVVNDAQTIYKWIKARSGSSKIFLWGHSLGTGVSSHLLEIVESEGGNLSGLILEAAFNNMADEVRSYPMSKVFRFLPWFDYFFTQPMYENGLRFESDRHLTRVKTPILMLHAADDHVVPVTLGRQLFKTVKEARGSSSPITFYEYPKSLKYGHNFICQDPDLYDKVSKFMEDSSVFKPF